MSATANTTPIVTTVTKPATNPRDTDATPRVNIQDFYFGEGSREKRTREDSHYSSARALTARPRRLKVRDRLGYGDRHVLDRLGHRRQSAFNRLSETYSPSTTKPRPGRTNSRDHPRGRSRPNRLVASNEGCPEDRERLCGVGESYNDSHSHSYHDRDRSRHMKRRRDNESPLSSVSKSDSSDGRTHDQSKRKTSEKRYDFRGHPREGRGSCRFTPLQGHQKKFLRPKQIEELVRAGKLSHLIKEIKHGQDQSKGRGPLIIEAEIGGHMIHRMYVDGGSSTEILYEHCFNRLRPEVKNQMVPATTSLTGFNGETIWPLEQLRLLVTIGDVDHSTRAWMNFMIVRSLSPYNGIIGRPGIKEIQAVPSIAHGMLKFPVDGGIVTIRSTILIPVECATVITSSTVPKEVGAHPKIFKVALHPNFPDQEVAVEGTLSAKGHTELCSLLKENLDIFAWQPSDMTRVPRSVAEHRLNIREGYSPVRQKE
nr:reverse transcriptase domain-containing protein [Tanacetum cinerariifolium]